MNSRLRLSLGVFAVFLAYLIFVYSDIVFFGESFAKRDILRYYYPMWKYAVDCWSSWNIPFWNPYHSFGKPFAANIQNCVFYPLQVLLHLPDFTQAFNVYILVHMALAGMFTALWLRDWGCSKLACVVGGFAFMYSGYMASAINLTISLCSITYFPLVLLCWRRSLAEKGLGWRIGLSVSLLLQYLAGDPSIFFSTLVVLSVATAYVFFEKRMEAKVWDWTLLSRLGFSMFVFLGLGAFHYPLFYEMLRQSTRSKMDYDLSTMWSIQFNDLIGLAVPFFSDVSAFFMDYWVRQSWLENYYAGISVLILGFWAYRVRRDRATGVHVLLFLFGLSLALGRFSGVYWFFNKTFPFFGLIRYPVRFFYLSYFALACLAAFAVDAIQAGKGRSAWTQRRKMVAAAVIGVGVILLGALYTWSDFFCQHVCLWMAKWMYSLHPSDGWSKDLIKDMAVPVFFNTTRTILLAMAVLIGLLTYGSGWIRRGLLAFFLLCVVVADVGVANNFEFRVHRKYLTQLGSNADVILRDKGLFRIYPAPSIRDLQKRSFDARDIDSMQMMLAQALTPNLLLSRRVSDMSGYDSLFLDPMEYVMGARLFVKHPEKNMYHAFLNGKYFVSLMDNLGPPFEKLNAGGDIFLYRDTRALPRAYLVRRAIVQPDRKKICDELLKDSFEPQEALYLQTDPGWLGPEGPDEPGQVEIDHYSPEEVRMTVRTPGPRWLFFSDAWYSAWRATIDGRPVPIEKANVAFRAVKVEAGTHQVVWKYDSILFKIGLLISLITVIGLFILQRRRAVGY